MAGITAAPFRLDNPSFVIDHDLAGGSASAVQLKCAGRRIAVTPDVDFEDVETWCNPKGEAPGAATWAIELEVLNSYGAAGLWNQLLPLAGVLVKFSLLPAGAVAVSATNPEMSGDCWVPYPTFVDAGVRKFTTYTLEFKVYGTPLFKDATPAVYSGHA